MKLAIGVMGTSNAQCTDPTWPRMVRLGQAIAEHGCTLITGACAGLPYAAVEGACQAGGIVVGISPGLSREEHVERYRCPVEGFDVLIYTGSGLMGREVENIRSSDIVILAGGRLGTLGEFAIAYREGRLIGVLSGTGGIADAVDELVRLCNQETGSVVLYDDDPVRLVDRLIDYYETEHYKHPNCFSSPAQPVVVEAGT